MFLNNFDSCMFDRFSNKHLKNRLDFILIIKKIWISIENLSSLDFSFWVWNEDSIWSSINVVIRLQFKFINHILMVTELFPHVGTLHLNHLHIVLVFLLLLVSHFFLLPSHPHFFLSLFHIGFFHLLFFNKSRIWLHIDWNDQGGKSISSNHTAIIHDVLRSNLTIGILSLNYWFTYTYSL